MGNCLLVEKKVIKIMKKDGTVVEYRGTMKVHHILTKFSPHYSLFDSLSNHYHLHPQAKLLCGRHHDPESEDEEESQVCNSRGGDEEDNILRDSGDNTKEKTNGIVRVKMVVSKKELEKLLQGGSVHELVSRSLAKQHMCDDEDEHNQCHRGWRPLLDSIPESN